MCRRLEGQVALVTGASRGIGRGIALGLAREGAAVVVNYHHRGAPAGEVVQAILEAGGQAYAVRADVTDPQAVEGMVAEALERFGRLDILVNNAGITRDTLMLRMGAEDWHRVIDTNLNAAFTCSKAVLRPMLRQRYGRIINIASLAGLAGNIGQVNYAAAKAGLVGLTKAMAREVAIRGITVNAVAPSFVETDLFAGVPESYRRWALSIIPMHRFARVEEVVAPVVFLALPEASYINGHVLVVDGGMVCP